MRVIEKIAYAFSHAVIFAAPNLLCLAVFDNFDLLNLDRVDIRRAEKPGNRYRSRADAVYECRRKQNHHHSGSDFASLLHNSYLRLCPLSAALQTQCQNTYDLAGRLI